MKKYTYYCDICGKEVQSHEHFTKTDLNAEMQGILNLCDIEDICSACRNLLIDADIKAKIKQMLQSIG